MKCDVYFVICEVISNIAYILLRTDGFFSNVCLNICSKYLGQLSSNIKNSDSFTSLKMNNPSNDLKKSDPDLPPEVSIGIQFANDYNHYSIEILLIILKISNCSG
jgi:hypothetical protein